MDDGDTGPVRWVAVGSYPFRGYAAFVASALEGSGIPANVVGDDGGGVLTGIGMLTGGVHVEVPEHDLEAARELLASLPAEDEDLDGWQDGPPEGDPDLVGRATDDPSGDASGPAGAGGPGAGAAGEVPSPAIGTGRAIAIALLVVALALGLLAATDLL